MRRLLLALLFLGISYVSDGQVCTPCPCDPELFPDGPDEDCGCCPPTDPGEPVPLPGIPLAIAAGVGYMVYNNMKRKKKSME